MMAFLGVISPRNSEPTSLTESMQLMDLILSDNKMERFEKIDKLEAILSAAALLPTENVNNVDNLYVLYLLKMTLLIVL